MKRFVRCLLLSLVVVAVASACQKQPPPEPVKPAQPAEPVAPPAPPMPKSDPSCVGPYAAGTPEVVKIGDTAWELNGATLSLKSDLKGKKLVIGAVTDIKEDTDENKKNLKLLTDWFKKNNVNLIVVAGDTGENAAQIESSIEILAAAKVPVVNIIGNREGKTEYRKAMVALKAKLGNVFDLNQVRRVDTPVADLVSMPGYFNASYIHSDDGCQYYQADLDALKEIIKAADSPVVLVSHGGPKQDGAQALDRTDAGENRGDPGLAKVMAEMKVPFGIFGNFHEAGGRGTSLAGDVKIDEAVTVDTLYVNPGPADAVSWQMNDGSTSVGMGALLTVQDGKASYQIHRLGAKSAKITKKPGKGK